MRYIGLRNLAHDMSEVLEDLPVIVTKYHRPVAVLLPFDGYWDGENYRKELLGRDEDTETIKDDGE